MAEPTTEVPYVLSDKGLEEIRQRVTGTCGCCGENVHDFDVPDVLELLDEVDRLRVEQEQMQDLLDSIWLYVSWRYVTKKLTTEQKELWADAVDASCRKAQIENGEDPHPVAERWWRDDFVEGGNG